MIFSTQQEELCESLGVAFTDIDSNGLFNTAQIKRWLNMAKDKATDKGLLKPTAGYYWRMFVSGVGYYGEQGFDVACNGIDLAVDRYNDPKRKWNDPASLIVGGLAITLASYISYKLYQRITRKKHHKDD